MVFLLACALSVGIELLGISIPSLWYRLYMLGISQNPDSDAIYQPQFSPIVGYLRILHVRNLDFGWVHVDAGRAGIDWLVIVLAMGFILWCTLLLGRAWRQAASQRVLLAATFVLAAGLSLFTVYRCRNDINFSGGPGYTALLQTVQRRAQPHDVMILNNDVQAPFLLNENRARIKWYGLSRDPTQWDDATISLLERLSGQYERIWLALDDSAGNLPDPTRAWLEQSRRKVEGYDFEGGVHLILFAAKP